MSAVVGARIIDSAGIRAGSFVYIFGRRLVCMKLIVVRVVSFIDVVMLALHMATTIMTVVMSFMNVVVRRPAILEHNRARLGVMVGLSPEVRREVSKRRDLEPEDPQ